MVSRLRVCAMKVDIRTIPTPFLIASRARIESNIAAGQAAADAAGISLWPNFKTHRCIEIAELQVAAGALGISCATVTEADVLSTHTDSEIFISNSIFLDESNGRIVAGLIEAGRTT